MDAQTARSLALRSSASLNVIVAASNIVPEVQLLNLILVRIRDVSLAGFQTAELFLTGFSADTIGHVYDALMEKNFTVVYHNASTVSRNPRLTIKW